MLRKWTWLSVVVALVVVLTACQPQTVIVEKKIVETVVVTEEKVVVETKMVEGKEVEVTRVVQEEVVKEVVVTATPEPEPTAVPKIVLDYLAVPLGTEPPTLDIQLATDTTSHLIIHQCIDGLFEYRGDGSIEPTGALDFAVSEDGTVYTINLRKDAVWSDGVPVIAQHFVDGVIRLLEPETAAEYAWLRKSSIRARPTILVWSVSRLWMTLPWRLRSRRPPPTLIPSCLSRPFTPFAWTSSKCTVTSGPSRATM